jgi:hypothetical protein
MPSPTSWQGSLWERWPRHRFRLRAKVDDMRDVAAAFEQARPGQAIG